MAGLIPGDLDEWLSNLGLRTRLAKMQKNLLNGFVDGVCVFEVTATMFPKMLPSDVAVSETLNSAERLRNWELLQRRILQEVRCEISKEDVVAIVQKKIDAKAIISFLRLLRIKLVAYKHVYDTAQELQRKKQKHLVVATSSKHTPAPEAAAAAPAPKEKSGKMHIDELGGNPVARMAAPSKKHTQKLLHKLSSREQTRLFVANLPNPELEIEKMYNEVSARYKAATESFSHNLDEKQRRSQNIDTFIAELRSLNLEELKKIEMRVSQLHCELLQMETGVYLNSSAATEQDNRSGQPTKIAHLTKQIMSQVGIKALQSRAGPASQQKKMELEEKIQARSAAIFGRLGLPVPGESTPSVSFYSHRDSSDEEEASKPQQPVFSRVAAKSSTSPPFAKKPSKLPVPSTKPATPVTDVEHDVTTNAAHPIVATAVAASASPKHEEPVAPRVATHKRTFDTTHGRYYYVDLITGKSTWQLPAVGIVSCVDESSSQIFFVDCATRATSWTL